MKFKVINGEPLQFHNQNGDLTGTIQISSSGDMIIRPESGSNNIIIGDATTTSTVEFGTVAAPVTLDLLGGGTITSNGNTLNIGSTGDTVRINNAIFTQSLQITGSLRVSGSAYATYFVGDGSGLTNVTALSASYASTASYVKLVAGPNITINQVGDSFQITGSAGGGASDFPYTGSAIISGSLEVTGSANLPSITGSLLGTASYALNSISASFSETASYVNPLRQTVYISGSLITTGSNTLIGNTSLTGSLNISGSTTQIGNNTLLGNTTLSGSIIMSGSVTNPTTPTIQVYGDMETTGVIKFLPVVKNIDTSISASYIYVSGSTNDLYFSQNGSGYNNVTRLRWLEGNLYTGLLHGGLITTQSSTVYQISSGSGIIVDLNASLADDPYPVVQFLEWGNLSASIAPLTASYQQAFVGIDATNNIFAQGTPFNNGQFDVIINIGNVLFQNQSTINGVKTQPSVAYGFEQQQNTFNRAFGPLKISGYTLAPSGSSTGSLIVGSGTSYAPGANYAVNPNEPYYVVDNGTNVSKIFRYRQSGSTWVYDTNAGAGYTTINPSQYSNNGILTTVQPNDWSIQRVFWFPNSVAKAIVVYYGNQSYSTEADAIANISIESFVEAPNTSANAIYLGSIIIRGNGVLTVPADFTIVPGGLFRQVGGSGGGGSIVTQTLSGLSDVNISGPTDGQPLVYNTTAAKWQNQSTLTATLTGNASTATSASYSATASYVLNAVTASYSETASYVNPLQQNVLVTGSLNISSGSLNITSGSQTFSTTFIPPGSGNIINLNSNGNLGLNAGTAAGIAFVVNNISQAMYITSASQVLIGNPRVSPLESGSATLHVTNVGTSNSFLVEDSTNPDSSPFVIDSIGRVGIGLTNLGGVNLHVSGNGAVFRLQGTNHVYQEFYPQGSTTRFGYLGYGSSGSGDLELFNESSTGRLEFGTSGLARMVISSSGNVGIVTNTPTQVTLQVNGKVFATSFTGSITGSVTGALTGTASFATSASNAVTASFVNPLQQDVLITGSLIVSASGTTNDFRVGTNDLFISASGNVGIGTTTPSVKLHVSGGPAILRLEGTDHMFQEFYPQSGGTRFGYLGYGISGSTDLRLFNQPVGGRMLFATENLTRMSIQANGNVGVGVSLPTEVNAKFHVNNTSTSASFLVEDSTNPDATPFIIDAEGRVGIGTTTPTYQLDITSLPNDNGTLRVAGSGSFKRGIIYLETNDIISGSGHENGRISFLGSGSSEYGTIISQLKNTTSGSEEGEIIFRVRKPSQSITNSEIFRVTSTGISIGITSSLALLHVNNTSTGNSFLVEDSTNPDSTPFVIDAAGNVGIGTTTPTALLHISSSTPSILTIERSINANAHIQYKNSASIMWAGLAPVVTNTYFGIGSAVDLTSASFVVVSGSGNVGIGTTTPNARLDVSGSAIVTGSVAVTQNITASAFATTDALITSTATTINSGITTIYNIPTASYDGAWFDYTIRSGSNARAGSIMGIWSGTAVNYAETTTTDFGNTSGFELGMSVVGANMILSSSATTSGWSFNAIVRSV